MIKNERIYAIKEKKIETNTPEKKRIEKIINLIQKKESKLIKKQINSPSQKNKNKPIVIVNPGHGFEDPGCVVDNPYFKTDNKITKTFKEKTIEEKFLNQLLSYDLVLNLLKNGFEVYLAFDFVDLFKKSGLKLPKNNPSLHILFKNRPPVRGRMNPCPCRIADASGKCISEIFKFVENDYLKKYNKIPKICSVCIHHDYSFEKKGHGFVPFYRNPDKVTSKKFSKNSKKLAIKLLKHCKDVNKVKSGTDISQVKKEEWVVCAPGKEVENAAAVLIEVGRLTNPEELKQILNPKKRTEMANAIKNAIEEYFK